MIKLGFRKRWKKKGANLQSRCDTFIKARNRSFKSLLLGFESHTEREEREKEVLKKDKVIEIVQNFQRTVEQNCGSDRS